MLNNFQIEEIKEELNKSQNPLFYFDNDQDGFCSFLLLRRFIGRGIGIPVKTSPLDMNYFRRIDEFNPDYVVILDQPRVSSDFFESLRERNIPILWIDHHEKDFNFPDYIKYYNPLYSDSPENVPVTKICYQINSKKEDLWIYIAGCIADKYLPPENKIFFQEYPDLGLNSESAFNIFYNSEIGKISRMMGIGLKDKTSSVNKMIHFFIGVKTPYEVLEENLKTRSLHKRFLEVDNKFKNLIAKAKLNVIGSSNLIFFKYSGNISMSADLANRLSYDYPEKIIAVCYLNQGKVNFSIRGKKIKTKLIEIMKDFPFSSAGGHEDAIGGQISSDQIVDFKNKLEDNFK